MLSATTRAWYLATWGNSATPVTSPTAHTPSATRQSSSTGTPFLSGAIPMMSSPRSCTAASARRGQRIVIPQVSVAELVAAGGTTTSPISRLHVADQG